MSDLDPSATDPSTDPAAQRRARLMLIVALILVLGAGVGGYFGWRTYQKHEAAKLAAIAKAEGSPNAPRGAAGRRTLTGTPADNADRQKMAQQYQERVAKQRADYFASTLVEYSKAAGPQRDAVVDNAVSQHRPWWRQIVQTPPTSTDPNAAEMLGKVRTRLEQNNGAATRPAGARGAATRGPTTRAARNRTPTTAPASQPS